MINYDDLVQKLQDGEITLVEFLLQQADVASEFVEFTTTHKLLINEESAKLFLDKKDDEIMNSQKTIL